ncbi:MAG: glycosyltransferase [Bacteroidetes bacterium]|nr:glycosyltransferase [Bacteroidota bacterium]MBL6942992.1 glycosyltransferase [Bacteroidales bacterium]
MTTKVKRRLKVLYLARWYPNRYDPMPGLFIQRHAEAANICCDVGVVYTHIVNNKFSGYRVFDPNYEVINGVPTAKVYYSSSGIKLFPFNKIINIYRFFKANIIGINLIKKHLGNFNIVHIHVLTRLGLIGLYYKILYGKPYIITEHWSRYLELTDSFNGFFRKTATRIIVKQASFVTTVTKNLAKAMQSHRLQNDNYIVLPNVVDNTFLSYSPSIKNQANPITFLHVSCFEDKSKNISGLLRVISSLAKIRNDFVFRLVGDGMDMEWITNYASELGLNDKHVVFTGLLEGDKLVDEMASVDMLVVFSNYENFPVVINESLSLGIPVIATRVGGIPERINTENGVLIDARDEDQLLSNLIDFLDGGLSFNMDKIQTSSRDEFSPETVGNILCGLYVKALN